MNPPAPRKKTTSPSKHQICSNLNAKVTVNVPIGMTRLIAQNPPAPAKVDQFGRNRSKLAVAAALAARVKGRARSSRSSSDSSSGSSSSDSDSSGSSSSSSRDASPVSRRPTSKWAFDLYSILDSAKYLWRFVYFCLCQGRRNGKEKQCVCTRRFQSTPVIYRNRNFL